MIMKPEPFFEMYEDLIQKNGKPYVIYASPQGRTFDTQIAKDLSEKDEILFLCGRYEGIDERCMALVDDEISIGDYVTSGAEFPVLIMMDSISRFCQGVVGNFDSVKNDSHYDGLLDHANYTRPAEFKPVSYTHLRAHETSLHLVCRLLLEKKKKKKTQKEKNISNHHNSYNHKLTPNQHRQTHKKSMYNRT
eukprot:TRINITY_DN3118_c0_g1_i2.p1 TRINITY_DN3118_c0_g1~~TRINITY_DN3118_c0_g1_i2.p1  ORF type:complete len:192 (-),score=37.83 TRINITY_DN3118_c0_g1_i2:9-584(-)